MDKRILDLLESHAEALMRGQVLDLDALAGDPALVNRIRPLATLAEQCKTALTPVAPSDAFRRKLKRGLELAAQHKTGLPTVIESGFPVRHWWVGAAAVGSALAAGGIIALAVRSRQKAKIQLPISA